MAGERGELVACRGKRQVAAHAQFGCYTFTEFGMRVEPGTDSRAAHRQFKQIGNGDGQQRLGME